MSAAQEEEIRQLHEQLAAAQSEKAAETARASALQVALFEAGMKARQAMDACKRDAVEVAVEEAVRQHYVSMAEMEEMVSRSVGQISRDKALLLTLRGTFLALKSKASNYARALQQQHGEEEEEEEGEEEGRPQGRRSASGGANSNDECCPSGDDGGGGDVEPEGQESRGEQGAEQAKPEESVARNSETLQQAVRRLFGTDKATAEPGREEVEGSTLSPGNSGLDDELAAQSIHAAIDVAALVCAVMVSPGMTSFLEDSAVESSMDKEVSNEGAQKEETDVTATGDGDDGDGTSEPPTPTNEPQIFT